MNEISDSLAFKSSNGHDSRNETLTDIGSSNGDVTRVNGTAKVETIEAHEPNDDDGADDDDDETEGEDEYDEDDEEEEPVLKYELFSKSLTEVFVKDSACAISVSTSARIIALGTHSGVVHAFSFDGTRLKSTRPHSASIIDIHLDATGDFIATASIDGRIVIHSISTPEAYSFDMKRPMRTVCLEPNFAQQATRSFVCGGMAGTLALHEKGWLGHKETTVHSGEGPIWTTRWQGNLIAWANDKGVKIYDTTSQVRVTYIDRPSQSPRPDLFKCNLHWQDSTTLLISWADCIKIARIRPRPNASHSHLPPSSVEISAVFQVECMIAGLVPHSIDSMPVKEKDVAKEDKSVSSTTSFLMLGFIPPDETYSEEETLDRLRQARKQSNPPELKVITREGEETSSDVLSLAGYPNWSCNDYALAIAGEGEYVVMNPKGLVWVRKRDSRDHVQWLVERKRFSEALKVIEDLEGEDNEEEVKRIGLAYIEHLVAEGDFASAATLAPKVFAQDAQLWDDWIFLFAERNHLKTIIPYVPIEKPCLSHLVYEMILAHFLAHDRQTLLKTITEWPTSIYDVGAVIVAVQAELDRMSSPSSFRSPERSSRESTSLMDCLAKLFISSRQPGKALPYLLRLRDPTVFDLIREHNLFTAVQDQALLLVEFDQELRKKRRELGAGADEQEGTNDAIRLLVDHTHSIPVGRVVHQLQSNSYFLFLYLDALSDRDPHLSSEFADQQVVLYAEFSPTRLINFLRASNYYSLENAYNVCQDRDLVPEMVFLLGRMGNNKKALKLIIERMGDVTRAIDFAKEQNDADLWEDLLSYSESKPLFIKGLLENAGGAGVDPIKLIRRIRNGLEIPGLQEALIKILRDFNIQISLLEGCQAILEGDCSELSSRLRKNQLGGFFFTAASMCDFCGLPLYQSSQSLAILFLCHHTVHISCVDLTDPEDLPRRPDPVLSGMRSGGSMASYISGKITFASLVRSKMEKGCPVCLEHTEGQRT